MARQERQKRVEEYRKISREADKLDGSGQKDEAIELLQEWVGRCREVGDEDYALFFEAEVAGYSSGGYDEAIQLMEEAFVWRKKEGLGGDSLLLRSQGVYYSWQGKEDQAINWFDKALEANPKDSDAMRQKGVSLSKKGDLDGAIEWFDKTLEENPKDYDVMRYKGIVFSKKGHHGGAIEWCNKALEVNPKDYDAIREMGTSLSNMGDEDGAIEWFDKALAGNPKDALAYRNKSVSEFNRGNKEESFKLLCKAVQLRPEKYRDEFIFLCNALGKDVKKEREKLFPEEEQLGDAAAKEPEASSEVYGLKGFIERLREVYGPKAKEFVKLQKEEEAKRNVFLLPESLFDEQESLLLTLRRWNSYTPAVPTGDEERSIGGGYFLKHGETGIVIDPGYHFIENFYRAGGRVHDIDVVVLTHAHNDHTIEFETLLTLVREYNESLKEHQKEGEPEPEKKLIDVYLNNGAFMKFSGLLNLRGRDKVRHIYTINAGNTYKLGDGVRLEVVEAYHDDVVAKDQSVGLIFRLAVGDEVRKVVFTSDTGLLPLDPESEKAKSTQDYEREVWLAYMRDEVRPDVLVVHIGAIKKEELDRKFAEPDEAIYANHLGIIGASRVIAECRPKLAIISEFGEEMKGFRCDLIRGMEEEVVGAFLKKAGQDVSDLRVVPGDLALRYDLAGERFFSCVSMKWNGYKNIDFSTDSEDEDKQSGIYYFAKRQRSKFEKDRRHFVRDFDGRFRHEQKMS